MATLTQIERKYVFNNDWDLIKYQILTYCYTFGHIVSDADLNCLTLLAISGEQDLSSFCGLVDSNNIFKGTQSARNCIRKCELKGLIVKTSNGKSKRKIKINPKIDLYIGKKVLLTFKIISFETIKS